MMEQILMNLVAGALGGNAVGKSSPSFDLGTLGNTISGLVGGGVLGQIITLLLPSLLSGKLDASTIITQLVGGGAGGAILTAIIGAIKNRAAA
jgi:uncharacterized membrane protein YeaQ/YmgE (transglycosylase-associated protein family)